MKYVDEFRDPAQGARAGRARSAALAAAHSRPRDGGRCRSWKCAAATRTRSSATASSSMLPDAIEFVHGPGCPVCVLPMGRVDDCVAHRRAAGGDLHHLRRRDARAGLAQEPAAGEGRRRRRAHGLFAAGRAGAGAQATRTARSCSSASASRRRCRRTALTRDPGASARAMREFLAVLQPHHHHPDDQGDPRLPRSAARRVCRARPCQHGDRHARPTTSSRGTTASRSWSPGSSRSTCCNRSGWC